jgi:molybdate transport system substrate-binding protein
MTARGHSCTRERAGSHARRGRFAAVLLLALPLTAACGADDSTTLRVLAASSLTDVFTELAEKFEADHEGVDVELSFGSSTDLAEQVADGAPADVLATADAESMGPAHDAGVVALSAPFAENHLVLVTPPDNPGGVSSLADLDGTTWVRCADEVPCGRLADRRLQEAGVTSEPASLEEDARSTLDKVVSGEADAGLVYATDAVAAGEAVRTVPLEGPAGGTLYYIASLRDPDDQPLADEFLHLVASDEGDVVLVEAGFTLPTPEPRDVVP